MHFLFLYADSDNEWNCSEWRAKIPSDSINAEHEAGRCPHTAQLIYLPSALDFNHPKIQQVFGRADAIVFQRNVLMPEVYAAMDYWRTLGKIVTVDLDDHYPGLPPSNPAHAFWILNKGNLPIGDPVAALCEAMRHADALVSPSKVLLQDYEHLVPGFWIPNWPRRIWYEKCQPKPLGAPDIEFGYQPDGEPQNGQQKFALLGKRREGSEGLVVIGWGGSISHVDSWLYSGAVEALDRILAEYPNTRLKFCGHEHRLNYILDRWGDRIIRQSGVKPEHWPFVVSTFDIGLAPLDMRPMPSNTWKPGEEKWEGGEYSYDERRSWLKGVEYICAGVPWIGTKSATYIDLDRHGVLVENGEENWYNALKSMIDNLPSRKRLAQEKKAWALKRYAMEANVNQYAEIYERIGNMKRAKGGAILPGVFWNKIEYEERSNEPAAPL